MDQKKNPTNPGATTPGGDPAALALKEDASNGARELTQEVKVIASDAAGQARKTAESQLAGGKDRAVEGLENVADVLRDAGEHLREKEENALPDYIVQAADQVDLMARYLRRHTLGQVFSDVEQYARREPALFLGGAFVLGLFGGRFLKSSRPRPAMASHEPRSQSNHEPKRASPVGGKTLPTDTESFPPLSWSPMGKPRDGASPHGPAAGSDGVKHTHEAATRPPGAG
jgi:hypothetical protein